MTHAVTGFHARYIGLTGIILIGLMICVALIGPLAVAADPAAQDLMRPLEPPTLMHPLGTDHLGRDVLARVVTGGRDSLGIAALCVALASGLGMALGLIAAYGGRFADIAIMRVADLMLAFPGILLALFFAGFFGGGVLPMLIGIKLTLWPQFARMTRAVALGVLKEPHVEAAQLAGFSSAYILTRHVLPPVLVHTTTLSALGLGTAIMSISSLGFLGLGLQPPTSEWGAMINELLPYVIEAPLQMAAPCIAIFVSVLGATLAGEGLAASFNRRHGAE